MSDHSPSNDCCPSFEVIPHPNLQLVLFKLAQAGLTLPAGEKAAENFCVTIGFEGGAKASHSDKEKVQWVICATRK